MENDTSNMYRELMAVGLLGTLYRATEDSEIINNVVETTLSSPAQYRICRAVVSGMAGNSDVAKGSLSTHVETNPDDEVARLALALSLVLAGDAEGKRAIEGLLVTTDDVAVRQTANAMLEHIQREPALLN
jgi:thioredoxin-like negative regulator of GroEL